MKRRKIGFGVFLAIYLVFLGHHAFSHLSFIMLIGFAIAVFAHAKANILTLALLAFHMGIEWYTFGKSFPEIPLILLAHVFLDFIFLHHEVKVHIKKYVWPLIGGILLILGVVFFVGLENANLVLAEHSHHVHNHVPGPECKHGHGHDHSALHDLTLGGVVGCVLSHTFFHFRKEK